MYIDDLLNYIESRYAGDELSVYLSIDDTYHPSPDIKWDNEHFNILNNSLLLSFDKSYSTPIKSMNKFLGFILFIYTLVCIILIYSLLNFIQKLIEPINNCLNKFKSMIKNSTTDFNELSKESELSQLEIISNILSKTFDDKIKKLIYLDDLTNLPNKKSLIHVTNNLIDNTQPFALIYISISDLFGYKFSDEVIKEFANELCKIQSNKIIITKYSENNFIIIYKDYTTDEDLRNFYNINISNFFKKKYFINDSIKLNLSSSVSIYPEQGFTIDKLIQKNEFMLDINKKQSKDNDLLFFDSNLYKEISRIESIKSNLRNALNNNEFKLLYQPIVDKYENVKKLEALIRWHNDELGFVPPDEFIKYSEEIGEIIPIGYWIFEEVCKNYNKLSSNSKSSLQISINVSPIQLLDAYFFDNILNILNKYMINPNSICIEVTESVIMETNGSISKNLFNLINLGIDTALDDFGTGYSSFSYLKQFNFSILKIDKVFIADANESDYKIVESIRNIAKELNIDVVIEGVETQEQLDNLKKANIDFFQGYHFSRPLSFEDITKFLRSST